MSFTRRGQDFDSISENLASIIDEILSTERSRDRRLQLIRFQIRRALGIGYRTGRGRPQPHAEGSEDR